ncbi:MBG domain-containing protein [Gilvimarinus algae]|uniref:MBG domain-containing protein n=1 Tax=Gilvimarinus algae TaxID=3058037 RepID=A0ABT8TC14_9GAMM|nr:MBG domain-containing protein [Gilvimarinus sp. SDUM040014]MDO3381637.1 MBG domain-containing protein [Gilvimarinus sp. SDUM040014]
MNRSYPPIWNSATGQPRPATGCVARPLALALAIAAASGTALAGPDGGVVIDGNAHIHHRGNTTDINQHTQNITVVWDNFDIDASEIVNFLQPNSDSIALNRVFSADGTQINGQLNANGRVFVLDANGVLFGKNAKVNVGSLVASTLDLSHADYDASSFTFTGDGKPAAVTNLGSITAADTGAVALLGGRVSNHGIIQAKLGNIALAAGNQITLDFAGDGLLNVQVDEAALNALAENHGLIKADGGQVLMTAHASDALLQTVVNNTGVIEAQTLQEQDGKILLLGGMTDSTGGTVRVSGTLDASAPEDGNGGFIETSGSIVKVAANATLDTSSANGDAGTWLLDPTNLEISYNEMGGNDGVSHVHTQALQNSLAGGNVILETADAGAGNGDITIVDPIIWASSNSLTLNADGGIAFNDYLHAPSGGLTLNAANNITTGAEGHINVASFTLEAGNFSQIAATLPTFMADDFVINGGTFTRATGGSVGGAALQITDVFGLQGLDTTPDADAVLVNDIDASGTASWNSGEGFNPIGDDTLNYTGTFDGAGHTVDGLTISRSGENYIGLFGYTSNTAVIERVGVTNVDIEGQSFVAPLVGYNFGEITQSYATGSLTGIGFSFGGLAGFNFGDVDQTYSTAAVSGGQYVGGLVGENYGDITQSYATGVVNGADSGGLVGLNSGTVNTSYWDGFTTTAGATGFGTDGGGSVFNATEVNGNWAGAPNAYNEATYTGFDFTNTWFIAEGSSRPMLRAFLDGGNISNLYQLQGMAANLSGSYTLVNDIDASATASTDNADVWGGRGFAPVGNGTAEFTGELDGQGFVIDGLTISRPDQIYVGLFGVLDSLANLTGVVLESSSIVGSEYVGSLAGYSEGSINRSYAVGTVSGFRVTGGLVGISSNTSDTSSSYFMGSVAGTEYIGGLVGISNNNITSSYAIASVAGTTGIGGLVGFNGGGITSSYATGSVVGETGVGGLVGYNDDSITASYATGSVTGTTGVGGIAGYNYETITNSYWDIYTSGESDAVGSGSNAGTSAVNGNWAGPPTAYNQASYTGFDFTNDWFIAEGSSRPMLRAHLSSGGEIHNLYDLQGMAANLSGSYTLMADIDASATADSVTAGNGGNYSDVWGGRGFAPVGIDGGSFVGSLDGNGFVIDGLTINRLDQDGVGLFGRIEDATLTQVGLTQVDITANDGVGALVGDSVMGTITGSFSTGQINANQVAGGLVGLSRGDNISGSYSDTDVTISGLFAGGLIGNAGQIAATSVSNSYALGDVSGSDGVGGLVGEIVNGSSISQSYASGTITGGANSGGLVGSNSTSTITDSFWNTDVEAVGVGIGDASGATGLSTAEFTDLASFAAWGADIDAEGGTGATWRIYEGNSAPLLRSFLAEIDVIAYDDYKIYDGVAYDGLHDINGTTGAGVRYGTSYAEFVSVFGENGTPYGSDAINSADLEYTGDSQGAIDAGTYAITPSELWSNQTGYDILVTDGILTIDQAVVSVTVTINDASKVYGAADPNFSWRVTSGTLGAGDTLTGNLFRDPGENVGTYDIHGNITGDLASGNYNVTLNEGVFTITPRAITISVADLAKLYGEQDPELTYTMTGSPANGDQLAVSLSRAAGENVGDYAITADVSGDLASDNYSLSIDNGVLTITPREVTVNVADLAKIYGEDDPALTWAVTEGSLAPGETLEGNLSREAGENVGDYAIMGELAGDLATANYTVTLNNGVLSISPRPIVISADDLVKIYGQNDPALTYTQGGTLAFDDTMEVSLAREDGSNVGLYTITPTVTGDVLSDNYALSVQAGALQITPAALTVTADDLETYWDLLPDEFTATLDGLTNGDTEADVFGDSLVVTSDLTLPIPGEYTLTPIATLASNNYTVTYNDGVLNLLSSNPGNGYGDGLTSTQFPARESLGRDNRANIYEGRDLLDGALDEIELSVLQGGTRLSAAELADIGLLMPRAVLFPNNSAVIGEEYIGMLERFVEKLKHYPDLTLLIEGHTSNTGPKALNVRLAQKRAMVVYNLLVELGVDPARMGTKGFDWMRPVADNSTLAGQALNRRTEITPDKPADNPAQGGE